MTQIISITLPWDQQTKIQGKGSDAISDDAYTTLREALELAELPELDARGNWYATEMLATVRDLESFVSAGINPSVRRVRGLFQESLTKLGVPEPEATQQQIVNITIPSASLYSVQRLQVIENECTNYIQSWLDAGWRIVAVCPPNDCRRPTFILGHKDKKAAAP